MDAYKNKIFISYKRVDKEPVFKLIERIESELGPDLCWVDLDDIEFGGPFGSDIADAICDAEVFLFMYSKAHSNILDFKKDWTIRELTLADEENKRVVFVNLDGTPFTRFFKFNYGALQYVDANSEDAVARLIAALRKWLDIKLNVDELIDLFDKKVGRLTLVKGPNDKYGFLNSAKQVVIPFQWDEAWPFQAGLARVRNEDKKIGYIDKKGVLRIKCRWNEAKRFSEGLAAVKNDKGDWGYINRLDEIVIPCQWRKAKDFKDGIATVQAYSGINWSIDKSGHNLGHAKDNNLYRS